MNENTSQPIRLHPEHLTSLFNLAHLMPEKKFNVLKALIHHLEPGTLKSTATREEIRQFTGLSLSTIYRIVKEFTSIGLLRSWRGPYELKQCFYLINLPVEPAVMEFYSESRDRKSNDPRVRCDTSKVEEDVMKKSDPLRGAPARLQLAENFIAHRAEVVTENNQPVLDPQIREVIEAVEANPSRGPVGPFLQQLGFLKMAGNDAGHLDRDGFLQWLLDRDCNNFSRFAELIAEFRETRPTIDLPMSSSVALHLHNRLGVKLLGLQWLRETGALVTKDGDGYPLPEHEIRDRLLECMRQRRIASIDELMELAKAQHEKELASRSARKAPAALHTLGELVRESEGGSERGAGPAANSADGTLYH